MGNKDLLLMQENEKNFEANRKELLEIANKKLGVDVLTNYHVQSADVYDNLNYQYFEDPFSQKVAIPFSDEQINHFIKMEKKLVAPTVMYNDGDGYNIYCAYLKGVDTNGKEVLFAFSITRPSRYFKDGEYFKFGMKLDMLVAGKEEGAVNLMRYDSEGEPHPNYVVNGKVVKSESEATFIPTPHFHKNSHKNIVLTNKASANTNVKISDYTPAEATPKEFTQMRDMQDKSFFKASMDAFVKSANMNVTFNDSKYYGYDFNNLLFLFNQSIDGSMGKGKGDK